MKRPRVLVADDDPHVRRGLRLRLNALGYAVVECADGLGVLRESPRGYIDAIILDHGMPNGDGRRVARMIRKESDVPIIFLSGYDAADFREIVYELPDVYFLSKPANDRRLEELLRALIGPGTGGRLATNTAPAG